MKPKLIRETKQMEELKEILPPLGQDDYSRLKESIRERGIQEPIKILSDGAIIDGCHRKKIAQELDIKDIPYEIKRLNKDEALELGISLNLARRNLSFEQKKEIIKKLRGRGWTQERVAKLIGMPFQTISRLEKGSNSQMGITSIPDLRYKISKEEEGEIFERAKVETQEQIASDYNITRRRVGQIIKKKNEQLHREKEIREASDKKLPLGITLLEGDFFDQINKVEDHSIDLLVVDPPYGVMDDYEWDKKDIKFADNWIKKIKPKLKENYAGFIFCDSRRGYDFETILRQYFEIKNRIIWVRKNMSMGRVVKNRFISAYEVIFYFGNKELNLPAKWGNERFDVMEYAVPQSNFKEGKYHPTQKPIKLIERFIYLGSNRGDMVLDCFAGSGTTGRACLSLGRSCIMIEKEPKYIDIIRRRIVGEAN
jgi:site-specific DNA-methyltransferase (adenine-specific)